MFLELYYEHYAENCNGKYWEEAESLPHGFFIREETLRREMDAALDREGFQCVCGENGYPLVLVNFTLKRYGRIPKAAGTATINDVDYTYDQFISLLEKFRNAAAAGRLKNNYAISNLIACYSEHERIRSQLDGVQEHDPSCLDWELDAAARERKEVLDCMEDMAWETDRLIEQKNSISKPDYSHLTGKKFLETYLKDHGITEAEIRLYKHWDGFYNAYKLKPDACGMERAKACTNEIIEYRKMSVDDIRADESCTPWAWPSAKAFQPISNFAAPQKSDQSYFGIYRCCYKGKLYYYGIGKEEAPITEKMRKNGKWASYNWTD